ncbi:hypothetical protein THASP1DRAFT_31678 [Thamnocephalis sphaerospora]|uniref:Galactose oxidase n=1 Tax=Thamnocephalis sphaerospora TaxID=78915 RepID=A0A4P9XL47_9FUNG|nr:hypothetical protein THASP1DRAFT_31678 [Thamnocephalis sphaerospora]|eukprot:RKP06506.1 hypothetical protein THASP1DRAFT_31678 [Thamnocephalis sphaerospora]
MRAPILSLAALALIGLPAASVRALNALARWGHTAALLDQRLYVFGGARTFGAASIIVDGTDEFTLTLDVTQSFNVAEAPWTVVPAGNPTPPGRMSHLVIADTKRERALILGGRPSDMATQADMLWEFHPKTSTWTSHQPTNGPSAWTFNTASASSDRTALVHGGFSGLAENSTVDGATYSLDLEQLQWRRRATTSASDAPCSDHTLSHIPFKDIYVALGGWAAHSALARMDTVFTYHPLNDVWMKVTVKGTPPTPRLLHSTVVSGQRIILFGGCNADFTEFYNDVAVLDTDTMTWFTPKLKNAPSGRCWHTATLLGDYMLVSFGYLAIDRGDAGVYALNIRTWEFVDTFPGTARMRESGATPDDTLGVVPPSSSSSPSSGLGTGGIVGICVGAVVLLALVAVTLLLLRRRNQKRAQLGTAGLANTMDPSPDAGLDFGKRGVLTPAAVGLHSINRTPGAESAISGSFDRPLMYTRSQSAQEDRHPPGHRQSRRFSLFRRSLSLARSHAHEPDPRRSMSAVVFPHHAEPASVALDDEALEALARQQNVYTTVMLPRQHLRIANPDLDE